MADQETSGAGAEPDRGQAERTRPTDLQMHLLMSECLQHFSAGLQWTPPHMADDYIECMALIAFMHVGRGRGMEATALFMESMASRARSIAAGVPLGAGR